MQTIAIACLGGLLLSAACSDQRDSTPTATDYDEIAQSMATTTAPGNGGGDVGSISDATDLAVGLLPLGFSLDGGGRFEGTRFGLTYLYSVTCIDAAGQPLAACGAATDRAQISVAWSGDLTLPHFMATVNRSGAWALSTLQTDTATVDGSGDFTFDSRLTAGAEVHAYHLVYASSYDAIRVRRSPRLIVGGTIHDTIDAERMVSTTNHDVDAVFHIDAVVTFRADGTADLVLDGTQHYVIDAGGNVTRA